MKILHGNQVNNWVTIMLAHGALRNLNRMYASRDWDTPNAEGHGSSRLPFGT